MCCIAYALYCYGRNLLSFVMHFVSRYVMIMFLKAHQLFGTLLDSLYEVIFLKPTFWFLYLTLLHFSFQNTEKTWVEIWVKVKNPRRKYDYRLILAPRLVAKTFDALWKNEFMWLKCCLWKQKETIKDNMGSHDKIQ